ncbi:MAG TPA: hypothetical protein EYG19_06490 [Verrucomicrobia bacterium]|nr:hypothetical protein [Verrucomicrobiota bacterium]
MNVLCAIRTCVVGQVSAVREDAQGLIADFFEPQRRQVCFFLGVFASWRFNPRAMDYLRDNAFQYYGCDWAAMVFTFLSIYMLGNRNRMGFVMGIGANIFWFSYGYMTVSIANMLCSVVVMLLQFRGWQKWVREDEETKEADSISAAN